MDNTRNFNIYEDSTFYVVDIIGVWDGGGQLPPPQVYKVGQMFNISRAKSGKLKSQKSSQSHGRTRRGGGGGGGSPPVCWANKASRAIFASQSGNIGLL